MTAPAERNGDPRVLIVDDDAGLREAIVMAFPAEKGVPLVETAADGQEAVERLAVSDVSLVVTDLKMPRLDGLGLLAHVREHYPDIPVMIMTAYGTPELRGLAVGGGAVKFLEKPFSLSDLQQGIAATLRRQSEGGALHGVSCGVFLQLVRMEQKTCTVRLADRRSGAAGVLYFVSGELVDARLRTLRGEPAALRILAWPEVSLAIENGSPCNEPRITTGLQALLLEALRLRDEGGEPEPEQPALPAHAADGDGPTKPVPAAGEGALETLRRRIEKAVPGREAHWEARKDPSWLSLLDVAEQAGGALRLGRLQGALVDLGQPEILIVAPRDGASVVLVDRDCPSDKVLGAVVD